MAKKKHYGEQPPGILVFCEMLQALQTIGAEQTGLLVLGALEYQYDKVEPVFENAMTQIVWSMYRPRLDANRQSWEMQVDGGKLGGEYSKYLSDCKDKNESPMAYPEWRRWHERHNEIVENGYDPTPTRP